MKLRFEIGDALEPQVVKPYWVLHGCNNIQSYGAGFVAAINKKYGNKEGSPVREYFRWFDDAIDNNELTPALGDIQFVDIGGGNKIVNMITQKGCGPVFCKKVQIGIPFRYEAFEECLLRVKVYAEEFYAKNRKYPTLVSPWIGCGLAMGDKSHVQDIIESVYNDIDIEYVIYDLPPRGMKANSFDGENLT